MADSQGSGLLRFLFAPMKLILMPFRLIAGFIGLFSPLVGKLSWSAPAWVQTLSGLETRITQWEAGHRALVKKATLAAVVVLIVIAGAYAWYLSIPKPVEFTISGTSPAATEMKEGAKPDQIHINISGSAARLDQVGKTITDGASISPEVDGDWRWTSDTQLTFTPAVDWAVGEDYTVKLDKKLFPDHVRLEEYIYEFSSAAFSAQITETEFYQDPRDPKIKKVVAKVRFSHPVDTADLESRIKLQMEKDKKLLGTGKIYPITVSYDKYKGEAYIHSENIQIPSDDTNMYVSIEKGIKAVAGGSGTDEELVQTVWIPGMLNFFRIQRSEATLVRNEKYEPEQVFIIEATAGVKEEELNNKLSVYLLPKDRPAFQDRKAIKNYRWHDPARIGPEVLGISERVKLEPMPAERDYATLHSFKYKADVGRQLLVRVGKGVSSFGGYVLAKPFERIITVPPYPRELKIMHNGSLLSLSGDKKLTVFSRGIDAIKFEIGRVMPDQINHLVSQTRGAFSSPRFGTHQFTQDNIVERFTETRILENMGAEKAQYTALDFNKYLHEEGGRSGARGLFFMRVQAWDPVNERVLNQKDERLVLITDMGVVVKDSADNSHDIFVQSLSSGLPVNGATISVLGRNGIPVGKVVTGSDGHGKLPSFEDYAREKKATVYVIQKGSDLSFLPFDRRDRELNLSRFDIGGETTAGRSNELNAFFFSDRGIYRPGDTFHFGMIVKHADWRRSLSGIPLETIIRDSRGLVVQEKNIKLSESGFESISYTTEETAPTGDYEASVYIVKDGRRSSLLGSASVKVEEFLPDRLKISTRFSTERERGWVSPEKLKGQVRLKNLFGTAAIDRRVAAQISLEPTYPAFRKFSKFRFFDPLRAEKSFSERLQDQKTNDNGEVEFDLGLEKFDKATYRLKFLAEGYEAEGGRGVGSESSIMVSPLKYLIGFKADGDLKYISKESKREINLIAVDSGLNMVSVKALKGRLLEIKHVSVLTRQPNGTYKYQSVEREIERKGEAIDILKKGRRYALATNNPGDYALVISDSEGVELNRVEYSVVGHANLTRDIEKNSELQVKINKNDYVPGEAIELHIKAPYTGAGLITIERDKVYEYKWFKATTNSTVQTIDVPYNLEGNGYINVAFLRSMDSKEVFMSPLSYGVVPFSVSKEKRKVSIKLETPEIARPGEKFRISYSSSKPSKIAIFAVDEGILQVADYKTPNPLAYFFRKRALEVRSSQILDLLLPEFELVKRLSAEGGGEYGEEAIGKNLNPFKRRRDKPVAYWSGIVNSDKTNREVTYIVPDHFNGTLRVMAVAVAPDAVGAKQKKAIVRGHFVLSPNVPTFVAPGDVFTVSVGVANNVEGSGKDPKVNLELGASKHIEILEKKTRVLTIAEGKEASATFKVKAKEKLGSANFRFNAAIGNKKSKYAVDASVRPPIPYVTTVHSGNIKDDDASVPVSRKMYREFRTNEAAVSNVPLGLARGLDKYLTEFPYGCTEQLVSKAIPALVLRGRPEFGYSPGKVEANLERATHILRARQNAEGAFGFWAANSHVSNYQTVYALHFLTEAKQKGYRIPESVLKKGLVYLRQLGSSNDDRLGDFRTRAYAIYVMTRNGIITTRFIAELRKEIGESGNKAWKTDLTAAYLAAAYSMLKLERDASRLMSDIELGQKQIVSYRYFYDGLSRDAQVLYLMANHFPGRLKSMPADRLDTMVKQISRGNFNTMSSAYAIMGFDAYARVVGNPADALVAIQEVLSKDKSSPLVMPKGMFPVMKFSAKANKIEISNKGDHGLFYQVTQAGFDKKLPVKPKYNKLEVQREYRRIDGKVIEQAVLGEEIEVHIKLRSVESGQQSNIAVVDLLPGGFEVVVDSATRSGRPAGAGDSAVSTWQPEYVDIREDRVVIYGSIGEEAREFVYRIKATNKGEFAVPPSFGESMYDRTVTSMGAGKKIRTVGNK